MANLQTTLRRLLPRGVAVEATGIPRELVRANDEWRALLPPQCGKKRLAEFAVGRYCVRRALLQLGAQDSHVGVGLQREPIAPNGFRVSISHDDCHAVGVATRAEQCAGLGIDIEPDEPLEDALVALVCRADELAQRTASSRTNDFAKMVFSAKESVFKACPLPVQAVLEWHAIALHIGGGQFTASLRVPEGSGITLNGIVQNAHGKWISYASAV